MSKNKVKLGEILVKEKVISEEELEQALSIHQSDGRKIGQILVELEYATEEEILSHLAIQLGIPYVRLAGYHLKGEIISLIPLEIAQKHNVIPVDIVGRYLTVAMVDPLDDELVEQLEADTGMNIQIVAATSVDISKAIEKYYLGNSEINDVSGEEADSKVIQTDSNPVDEITAAIEEMKEEDVKAQSRVKRRSSFSKKGHKLERKYRSLLPSVALPTPVEDESPESTSLERKPLGESSLGREPFSESSRPDDLYFPEYTIESFIAGQHAETVIEAVIRVCESDAPPYNPLFICSGVGLGKTHILKATANYMNTNKPHKRVKLVNCRLFSVKNRFAPYNNSQGSNSQMEELANELFADYFEADMLLVDDVHLVALDRQTQETFMYIFDEIIDYDKQIVLTGDSALLAPVTNGYKFEESLLSRVQSGLTLKIEPPSLETRLNILRKALEDKEGQLPYETLTFIAHQNPTDVRKLLASLDNVLFLEEASVEDYDTPASGARTRI